MDSGAPTFVVIRAPGVRTTWLLVAAVDGADVARRAVADLAAVEQAIAEITSRQAHPVVREVHTLGRRQVDLRGGVRIDFEWRPVVVDWRCLDCGVDTDAIDEYYMVHDELWTQAVADQEGHLCVGCLEARLGRQLTAADFTDATVNLTDGLARSDRLRDRLGALTSS